MRLHVRQPPSAVGRNTRNNTQNIASANIYLSFVQKSHVQKAVFMQDNAYFRCCLQPNNFYTLITV